MIELLGALVVLVSIIIASLTVFAMIGVAVGVFLAAMLIVVEGLTAKYKKHASTGIEGLPTRQ